jgi:3-hydroxyisobutyrate dehydrogenase-like beta-hydroxyacid dehydrogenase
VFAVKVGFIGLGRMGAAIASNLVRAGHEVAVWNRSRDALLPLTDIGANEVAEPRDALQGDILISMLANDNAFHEVGLDGPLLSGRRNRLSTSMPRQFRSISFVISQRPTLMRASRTSPRLFSAEPMQPPLEN